MIESLKPYPAMKNSGVPWLGEVPRHWKIMPLKRIGRFSGGTGFPIFLQGSLNEEILFIKVSDMNRLGNERLIVDSANTVSRKTAQDLGAQIFPKNTIVFPKVGGALLTNKRRFLTQETCIDNNIMGCVVTGADARFAFDLLAWLDLARIAKPGPVPAISESEVREIRVAMPPLPEQNAIVRFLDHADRRFQRYIRAKQKLNALLEEQKQAIIHQAVTGQVDVRTGQPYPAYKPSGVKWLGDVPAHWKVTRVRQAADVLRGKFTHRPRNDPSLYGGPYPFIQTGEVARAEKAITTYRQTLNERGLAVSRMFPSGTLVMAIAANIGDVAVLDFEACFPDSVVGFVPRHGVERDFLFYVFRAMKPELLREAPVNTQGNLNIERIDSRGIPIASVGEQRLVVQHLEASTGMLDTLANQANHEVDLLREYRTRLVADVVTGKLDVRKSAESLPEIGSLTIADEPEDAIPDKENALVLNDSDAGFGQAEN